MSTTDKGTIAVTGATGFVGRSTVRALLERGYAVRALIRDLDKARSTLPSEGVSRIVGSVLDAGALAELLRGCAGVVHTIGIRRELPGGVTFARLHPQATAAVIAAAQREGAQRLIHISALGVRPDAPTAYHASKYQAEVLVRASGLDWTILRPSIIHGPDSELMAMIKSWVLGRSQPFVFIPWFARVRFEKGMPPRPPRLESAAVQPVSVEDVAAAAAEAIGNRRAIGEAYPLAGPDRLDWPGFMAAVRDAMPLTDRHKRIVPIPGPLGFLAARAAHLVGLGAALPFGPSEPVMATEDSTCSLAKAREHLGFQPRPFLPTLQGYAARI